MDLADEVGIGLLYLVDRFNIFWGLGVALTGFLLVKNLVTRFRELAASDNDPDGSMGMEDSIKGRSNKQLWWLVPLFLVLLGLFVASFYIEVRVTISSH